ncbi:MAG TPA: prepilin-type N-terminal cleavage/methylation domain-containing protein [Planosporangium sp.]|jgi:type IV pilus assembly protein PilA|nr:prepilin-type N-terminal cleavage/methylation domain-containing protein [Planosporangium sp.]
MQETLRRMREKRATGDRGFTLIELLVVVVIIGVLVGIAIPLYLNYTKGAANKTAQSDVRGAVSALEQYYTENGNTYPTGQTSDPGTPINLGTSGQKITVSAGNKVAFATNSTSFIVCGQNKDGQTVYKYDSAAGGSVVKFEGTLAACAPLPAS